MVKKNLCFFPPALHKFANFELFLILPEKRRLCLPLQVFKQCSLYTLLSTLPHS